jgi:hypothetical protein
MTDVHARHIERRTIRIEARGAAQDEAWRNAVLQAEAVGMAGQFRGS